MRGLIEHAPHVDTAEPASRSVDCDRMEPWLHPPAEKVIRCRN